MTGSPEEGSLDLWIAACEDLPPDDQEAMLFVLSPEEIARCEAFVSAEDRRRFLLARWLLRTALGHILGRLPEEVEIASDPGEKPALAGTPAEATLPFDFNLSHSDSLAAVIVASAGEAGIDVEPATRKREALEIGRRRFTESENEILRSLEPGYREEMALWMWTAKEAGLKALGVGLSGSLDDVELAGTTPEALRFVSPKGAAGGSRTLIPLRLVSAGRPRSIGSIVFFGSICVLGGEPPEALGLHRLRPGTLDLDAARIPAPPHRVLEIPLRP